MSDEPVIRRRTVSQGHAISDARTDNARTQSQYQPYKDAAWGFINHWYPAVFSKELAEDEVKGIQICGIPIVLHRVDGKVYALKDQCLHRGVRLSEKPMCFNKKTISRWNRGIARPGKGVAGAVKTHSIRFKDTAAGKPPGYFVDKIED